MYCDNLQPWKQTRHLTSLHFVGHFIRIFWERDKFAQRDRGEGERTGWWEVRGYPGACEHQADTDTAHHQLSGQPTPPCACVSFCNINNTLPSLPLSLSSNLSSKNQACRAMLCCDESRSFQSDYKTRKHFSTVNPGCVWYGMSTGITVQWTVDTR